MTKDNRREEEAEEGRPAEERRRQLEEGRPAEERRRQADEGRPTSKAPVSEAEMARSQYRNVSTGAAPDPTGGGGRLGENLRIGCLYAIVGFAALALTAIFVQIIWRMFFL